MKPIKTQQRFRCDFCKKSGISRSISKHEPRCFRNPNRFCDYCQNKGFTMEEVAEGFPAQEVPCYYCGKFDKKKLEEIEIRESKKARKVEEIPVGEVPF